MVSYRISRVYIYFSTLGTRIDPAGERGEEACTDPWLLYLHRKIRRWGRSSRYTSDPSVPRRPPLSSGFCLRAGRWKGDRGGRGATTDGGRRDDARRVQIPPRGRAAPGFLWANLENYRPGWPRANATTDAKGRPRLPVVPPRFVISRNRPLVPLLSLPSQLPHR